jgi:hypothetical protein
MIPGMNRRRPIALLASAVCAVGLATVGGTGASVAGEGQSVPSLEQADAGAAR